MSPARRWRAWKRRPACRSSIRRNKHGKPSAAARFQPTSHASIGALSWAPVLRFLVRRIVLTIPVLLGVATLVFSLIHLVPGDPVQAMLGESASPQDVAELRARLGLDRPLVEQYGRFLSGAARGDLGRSMRTNQPVM